MRVSFVAPLEVLVTVSRLAGAAPQVLFPDRNFQKMRTKRGPYAFTASLILSTYARAVDLYELCLATSIQKTVIRYEYVQNIVYMHRRLPHPAPEKRAQQA